MRLTVTNTTYGSTSITIQIEYLKTGALHNVEIDLAFSPADIYSRRMSQTSTQTSKQKQTDQSQTDISAKK